jgi:hypothetical protein
VDASWDEDERREVAGYLSNGTVVAEYRGLSHCRFCHQANGHREYTDRTYRWPEGLAHYVWIHNVRLPSVVVEHTKSRLKQLRREGSDRDWWRTAQLDQRGPSSAITASALARLRSAGNDWSSQRQSEAVIHAKAARLRSALEEAKRLGEVTGVELYAYEEILEDAPSRERRSGPLREMLRANEDGPDGTDRTI